MKRLTAALVGCGAISRKHIQAVADNREAFELVSLCDTDQARATSGAEQVSAIVEGAAPKTFVDVETMLDEIRPEVVAVATSSHTHAPIATKCIEAGAHVILEKPVSLDSKSAAELVELAEKRRRKLAVCCITRFEAHVSELRRALDEGRLGRVLHGAVQVRWNRSNDYYAQASWRGRWSTDGGMLMNQGSHAIDLLHWFLGGDAIRVAAVIRRYQRPIESEDFAAATVEFSSGAVGIIEATVNTYPSNLETSFSLFCERGTVVFGGSHMERIETWRAEGEDEGTVGERIGADENGALHGHSALYADFHDAVVADRAPYVSGRDGLGSLEIVLAAYQSALKGTSVQMPVDFSTREMEGAWSS